MKVLGLTIAIAVAAAMLAHTVPVDDTQPALRGPAVVVLWATWCASCKAELARLPQIAPAAAPLPLVTLAIDSPELARATLVARDQPVRNAYADPRERGTVLADWGGPGGALPLAVAIDGRGRVCGRKAGLLGTDQLKQWARICSK